MVKINVSAKSANALEGIVPQLVSLRKKKERLWKRLVHFKITMNKSKRKLEIINIFKVKTLEEENNILRGLLIDVFKHPAL